MLRRRAGGAAMEVAAVVILFRFRVFKFEEQEINHEKKVVQGVFRKVQNAVDQRDDE
jgi:hypothetical protein